MRRVDQLREIPHPKIVPELVNNPITPEIVLQSHEMRINDLEEKLSTKTFESKVSDGAEVNVRLNQLEQQNQELSLKLDEARDMLMKLQAFMIETNMMVTESKRLEEGDENNSDNDSMSGLMKDGNALEKMLKGLVGNMDDDELSLNVNDSGEEIKLEVHDLEGSTDELGTKSNDLTDAHDENGSEAEAELERTDSVNVENEVNRDAPSQSGVDNLKNMFFKTEGIRDNPEMLTSLLNSIKN